MDYGTDNQSSGSGIKNSIIELIQFGAIVLAVLVIIRFFVAETHRVSGSSMVPNFVDGDVIITNLLATRFGTLQRGEVIILIDPNDSTKDFIKRIVGLPGEKVKLVDGKVFIDDQPLNEPYLPAGVQTHGEAYLGDNQELTIPAGYYFVLGDNRPHSSDSRDFGPIKKSLIVGQAWFRYWPSQRITPIVIDKPSLQPQ